MFRTILRPSHFGLVSAAASASLPAWVCRKTECSDEGARGIDWGRIAVATAAGVGIVYAGSSIFGHHTQQIDQNTMDDIFQAARRGDLAAVETFIKSDSESSKVSESGATPLDFAVTGGNVAVVKAIIDAEYQAAAEASKDTDRMAHLNLAMNRCLYAACSWGNSELVDVLIQGGADTSASFQDGAEALHIAAMRSHPTIVDRLIQAEVDIDSRTDQGDTAFLLACAAGDTKIMHQLIEAGCQPLLVNTFGAGALHLAAVNGRKEAVDYLVELGVDPTERFQGVSPAELAMAREFEERVSDILKKAEEMHTHSQDEEQPTFFEAAWKNVKGLIAPKSD